MLSLLAFLVVLGVLIFVHELGHLLAAKWAGMYVHRFSIGMGPVIPGCTWKRAETEYALSWLPLGGYVRVATREEGAGSEALEGEADDEAHVPEQMLYERKPVWKRIIFVLGGIVFNLVFAWLVYSGLALKNGRTVDPETRVGSVQASALPAGADTLASIAPGTRITAVGGEPVASWNDIADRLIGAPGDAVSLTLEDGRTLTAPIHQDALAERLALAQALGPWRTAVVGALVPSRPAERAGIQVGDTVVAVDGAPVGQWYDLVGVLSSSPGKALTLDLRRGGTPVTVTVTPLAEQEADAQGRTRIVGRIGMGVASPTRNEPLGVTAAFGAGFDATVEGIVQIWRTIKGMLTARISNRELGGPILIGQLAGQSARLGIDALLGLMALLSVNLAIFNLLPVPVLDGGQLVFLVLEGVLRRPVPLVIRLWAMRVGVAAVGLLMVLAFSNDLRRVLGL